MVMVNASIIVQTAKLLFVGPKRGISSLGSSKGEAGLNDANPASSALGVHFSMLPPLYPVAH